MLAQNARRKVSIFSSPGDDESALEDFKHAASLGSEFAKAQVIALNPYAAMCNAMMKEMIHKVRTGELEG